MGASKKNPSKKNERLMEAAVAQGFELLRERRHYVLLAPDNQRIVVIAKNANGSRNVKNILAELKRHGFKP